MLSEGYAVGRQHVRRWQVVGLEELSHAGGPLGRRGGSSVKWGGHGRRTDGHAAHDGQAAERRRLQQGRVLHEQGRRNDGQHQRRAQRAHASEGGNNKRHRGHQAGNKGAHKCREHDGGPASGGTAAPAAATLSGTE